MNVSVYQWLVNGHEIEPLRFFFASLQAVAGVLAVCFLLHAPLVRQISQQTKPNKHTTNA
jgi:hypothetical protein